MLDNPRSPPQQLPGGRARERAGGAGWQGGRAAGGQDRHAHQVGQQLQLAPAGQLAPRSCCRQLRTLEARLSADMRTIVELLQHQPAHTTNTVQQPPRSQSQPSDVTVGSGSR